MRAYKTQCSAINNCVVGILNRAINENITIIIEGVHLIPGNFFESELIKNYDGKLLEMLVYIDSEEIHKNRFIQRQIDAPNRKINQYLDNFKEIRWINDYLIQRAKRYEHIHLINNSENIKKSVNKILNVYDL